MNTAEILLAIEHIKILKARYFRAVDLHDRDELLAVFAPDLVFDLRGSTVDATGFNPVPDVTGDIMYGRDEAVEKIFRSAGNVTMAHQGYLPQIEILSEARAKGIWGVSDVLRFPDGKLAELRGHGIYYDTYEIYDGVWKIKTSTFKRSILDAIWRDT